MAKTISVLMGIYNCAPTLKEAIDSILAQTYPHWELILCDDGSCDDTCAIAEAYRQRFPDKIKLLRNEKNMGLNYTLNRCIEAATGEYMARMDGDDISVAHRFQTEIEFLEANPQYALVSCPMIYFDENGDFRTGLCRFPEPEPERLIYGTIHCHAPCMIRSEVMRQVGGYSVDKKLLRVEDWHLWLKVYTAGYRGYNLDMPLYKMRDDRNATGRRKFRYRFNEAYVSRMAVKKLKLPVWKYIYSLRPIIVGLLPLPIYNYLHRKNH